MSDLEKRVELLPCPFCGSKASLNREEFELVNGSKDYMFQVVCTESHQCGHRGMLWNPAKAAIRGWNARALSEREKKLVEALKAIKTAKKWDNIFEVANKTLKELGVE